MSDPKPNVLQHSIWLRYVDYQSFEEAVTMIERAPTSPMH